jgi:hypothetical protein
MKNEQFSNRLFAVDNKFSQKILDLKEERRIKKTENCDDLLCNKNLEVETIKNNFIKFIKENNIESLKRNYLKIISKKID